MKYLLIHKEVMYLAVSPVSPIPVRRRRSSNLSSVSGSSAMDTRSPGTPIPFEESEPAPAAEMSPRVIVRNANYSRTAPLLDVADRLQTDALSKMAETWVSTRLELLNAVRIQVQKLLSLHGGRDVLADSRNVGKGRYGEVNVGCVANLREPSCKLFAYYVNGIEARAPFYIANKLMKQKREVSFDPFQVVARHGTWNPTDNYMREIILGRMANYLVRARISPHFPFLYETYFTETPAGPHLGILMEMSHMDFPQFIRTVFPTIAVEERTNLLRVILIQITQALAAMQTHFNWRHNDLHYHNIMVTFVAHADYCYVVNGVNYVVPNYGMCWRIIDYGLSSSDVLFHENDNFDASTDAKTLPYTYRFIREHYLEGFSEERYRFEPELNDLIRFITTVLSMFSQTLSADAKGMITQFIREVHTHAHNNLFWTFAKQRRIADPFELHTVQDNMRRSRGQAMRRAFAVLARPYRVPEAEMEHCTEVYDIESPLFRPGQELDGVESHYYEVTSSGHLRQK